MALFDIDFFTSNFQGANLEHPIHLIRSASKSELIAFRSEVKKNMKNGPQDGGFVGVDSSPHDLLLSAINYELMKRSSFFYSLYKMSFPIRRTVVSVFSGKDLKEHEAFGTLYVSREDRQSIFHMPHNEIALSIKRFWLKHWKYIITTLIIVIFGILQLRK